MYKDGSLSPVIYQSFRNWLGEIENLLFPQSCAGCGEWDTALCPKCAQEIGGQWSLACGPVPALSRVIPVSQLRAGLNETEDSRLPFPVWRLGTYEGTRRRAIITWKNQLSRELTARIVAQIRQRGREVAPILLDNKLTTVALIPAPSRPLRKKEGLFVVGHSARAFAEGLHDGGIQAQVCDVLAIEKNVTDRRAKASAIYCVTSRLPDVPIVLVDDVLVTGSTLVGCVRALERHGGRVCCAFVIAQQEKWGTREKRRHKNAGHRLEACR